MGSTVVPLERVNRRLSGHHCEEIPLNTRLVFSGLSVEFSYSMESSCVIARGRSENAGHVVRRISPEKYFEFLDRSEEIVGTLLGASLMPDC